jgi:hypothetical protein
MEMNLFQLAIPGTVTTETWKSIELETRTKGKNEKVYKRKKKGREELYRSEKNTYSNNYEAIGRH